MKLPSYLEIFIWKKSMQEYMNFLYFLNLVIECINVMQLVPCLLYMKLYIIFAAQNSKIKLQDIMFDKNTAFSLV